MQLLKYQFITRITRSNNACGVWCLGTEFKQPVDIQCCLVFIYTGFPYLVCMVYSMVLFQEVDSYKTEVMIM